MDGEGIRGQMKRVLLIVNPVAGRKQIKPSFFNIVTAMSDAGCQIVVKTTKGRGDATEFAYNAAKNNESDIIVCAGGDGTFNEMLTGVMRSGNTETELGYIPAGSTNDFANSLKIPLKPVAAVKNILKNDPTIIDVGRFNDRYFSYIASFGIFTASSYSAPQSVKNVFGHLTYVFEAIKDLSKVTKYHIKATVDGNILEDDYIFGAISNSSTVGGVVKLKDGVVDLSDGEFEVTFVRNPSNISDFNQIVAAITSSKLEDCEMIDFARASKITVESDIPIPWSLDGEYADGGTFSEIENIHLACKLRK